LLLLPKNALWSSMKSVQLMYWIDAGVTQCIYCACLRQLPARLDVRSKACIYNTYYISSTLPHFHERKRIGSVTIDVHHSRDIQSTEYACLYSSYSRICNASGRQGMPMAADEGRNGDKFFNWSRPERETYQILYISCNPVHPYRTRGYR
jgi:hypothetical protein